MPCASALPISPWATCWAAALFNLLILAVLDLTRYSHGRMFSETSARHALAGSMSIALTAIAALFIFLAPT